MKESPPPELEQYIQQQITAGPYQNAEPVIHDSRFEKIERKGLESRSVEQRSH